MPFKRSYGFAKKRSKLVSSLSFLIYFFVKKKIPLSRRVEYVMGRG